MDGTKFYHVRALCGPATEIAKYTGDKKREERHRRFLRIIMTVAVSPPLSWRGPHHRKIPAACIAIGYTLRSHSEFPWRKKGREHAEKYLTPLVQRMENHKKLENWDLAPPLYGKKEPSYHAILVSLNETFIYEALEHLVFDVKRERWKPEWSHRKEVESALRYVAEDICKRARRDARE